MGGGQHGGKRLGARAKERVMVVAKERENRQKDAMGLQEDSICEQNIRFFGM